MSTSAMTVALLTATATASLEDRMIEMERELAQLRAEREADLEERARLRPHFDVHAYVDLGAFIPFGSGAGVVQDFGKQITGDQFAEVGWVFLGDLLSTMVNSRGEAADLGELPGVSRFDSVNSRGAAGFILNEVNINPVFSLGTNLVLSVSINFVPRTGSEFGLGDFFDLDLAQLSWFVTDDRRIAIHAGKIEPVFGIEYRFRKASNRFGVTPSLAARYDSGSQLGIKARVALFDDWLTAAASLTNGTGTQEQFHFYDEVDSNDGKTVAGRLAFRIPLDRIAEDVFDGALEIGASGQWGPQDRASNSAGDFWLVGADVYYTGVDLRIKGQLMKGAAPGDPVDGAYRLDLKLTGYLEIDYLILPWLGVLARFDYRNAVVALGNERAYLANIWRLTAGLTFPIDHALVVKAEFVKNGELGILPQISNDIITSSFLLIY